MTLLEPAAPLSLSAAWRRHSSLLLRLCAVPFLTSCKPSEAFLSVYLTQPVEDGGKGLSSAQLNEQVWPYDTYGAFVFMLPAGYLAEVSPSPPPSPHRHPHPLTAALAPPPPPSPSRSRREAQRPPPRTLPLPSQHPPAPTHPRTPGRRSSATER